MSKIAQLTKVREPASTRSNNLAIYLFLILISGLVQLGYYGRVRYGDASPDRDMNVWRSLGETVLNEGVPLYVGNAWDNKPPLFEFLNLGIAASDHYYIVFLAAVAVANGTTACLIYKIATNHNRPNVGILTGILFLSSVTILDGVNTTPRPFAITALMAAFLFRRAIERGVFIAISGLFIQVTGVAALPLGIIGAAKAPSPKKYVVIYTASITITLIIIYGLVGAVWGIESLYAAVRHTIFGAAGYAGRGAHNRTLVTTLIISTGNVFASAVQLIYISIPTLLILIRENTSTLKPAYNLEQEAMFVGLTLLPTALLRAADDYLLAPFAVFSLAAAVSIIDYCSE